MKLPIHTKMITPILVTLLLFVAGCTAPATDTENSSSVVAQQENSDEVIPSSIEQETKAEENLIAENESADEDADSTAGVPVESADTTSEPVTVQKEEPLSIAPTEKENAKTVTPEEQTFGINAALEMYRDFLLGNITANYQEKSLNYDSIMYDYYIDNDSSEPPRQTFTLTDADSDNVPELKVNFWSLENGGLICTVKLQEEHLEITEMEGYGYMDTLSVFKDGTLRLNHGLSAVSALTWLESATGEHLAVFEMLYREWHGESTAETMNEEYERWTSEGYEYVYVTSDDQTTWEEFEEYIAIYLLEQGKELVDLYEVNEESIQLNLKWQ